MQHTLKCGRLRYAGMSGPRQRVILAGPVAVGQLIGGPRLRAVPGHGGSVSSAAAWAASDGASQQCEPAWANPNAARRLR